MNKLTIYTATILAICACMLAPPKGRGAAADADETKKTQDFLALLTPQVTFCPSLKKLSSSVEVRGAKYQAIFSALKASDYTKAGEAISERASGSLDTISCEEFKRYYERKLKEMRFPILLKTTFKLTESSRSDYSGIPEGGRNDKFLYLFRLDTSGRAFLLDWKNSEWVEHPDGIGYVNGNWKSSWGPLLIVAATPNERDDFFRAIYSGSRDLNEERRKDMQRVQLGEMTEKEYDQKYQKILDEFNASLWAKALKWAEGL